MSVASRLADKAVGVYQRYISRDYNAENDSNCLYFPSCSAYMRGALKEEGPLQGTVDGLLRLQRCNKEGAAFYLQEFGKTVLTCPTEQLEDRFEFDTDEDRRRLVELKGMVEESRRLFESGDAQKAQQVTQQWTTALKDEVHFRVIDRPGQDHSQPTQFLVTHNEPREPEQRTAERTALQTVAGVVGGAVGAVLGAAAFGALHLSGGGVLGTVAGLGKTDKFNGWISEHHGPATVHGLSSLEKKMGTVGHKVHRRVAEWTGSALAASVAGVAVGLPVALVKGLAHGVTVGGRSGWQGGSILSRNLAAPPAHPQACSCGQH